MFETLISLLLLGAMFGIVYLLSLLSTLINAQISDQQKITSQSASRQSQHADSAQRRAIQLLYGDYDVAHRLAERVRANHPNRDERWIWEKVVFDLERDRER